jgi:hypothetical protein
MALTLQEIAEIEARKRELMRQFALGRSQSEYDRGIFDQNYRQQQRDLSLRLADLRQGARGNLLQRGVFGSGIANQQFGEIATQGQREGTDLAQAFQQGQGQFDLRNQQLEQDLQGGLQGVEQERAAREAAIAAQIAAATQAPTVQPATGARAYAPTGAPPVSRPRNAPAPVRPPSGAPQGIAGGGGYVPPKKKGPSNQSAARRNY